MKKSVIKTLSAFLVLVLVLSVLPMAALAAEPGQHVHTGECCQSDIDTLASCNHVFVTTLESRDVPEDDLCHKSYEVEVDMCVICGYTTRIETGYYTLNKHTVENWAPVTQEDGTIRMKGSCTYCHAELIL